MTTYDEAKQIIDKTDFPRKRVIENSAEVTLNVGNMQFLKIRHMISEEVSYGSQEFMDAYSIYVQHELATGLKRNMVATLVNLGKTTDVAQEFFDLCRSKVKVKETKKETDHGNETSGRTVGADEPAGQGACKGTSDGQREAVGTVHSGVPEGVTGQK